MSNRPPTLDDLLELARAFVAAAYPGESATDVRIRLTSGRRIESPVPVVPVRRELPSRRHSPDFRSVSWEGEDYSFSATQAAVVKCLWESMEDGVPDVGMERLKEEAGGTSDRLRDLFRGHGAWGTLIVVGQTRGTYKLAC